MFSPGGTPAVLDEPVLFVSTLIGTKTDQQDTVIQVSFAALRLIVDAALVQLLLKGVEQLIEKLIYN